AGMNLAGEWKSSLRRAWRGLKGLPAYLCPWRARDELAVQMPFLRIELARRTGLQVPHEVHIIVPRAEFRGRRRGRDGSEWEFEVILSSISVVHAPRHPPAGRGAASLLTAGAPPDR
ncbi:MAG: hypothetical protein QJR13_09040, partial [Bacillota bacterium]|nr:hypothetical protein [Bacillota bacterium]